MEKTKAISTEKDTASIRWLGKLIRHKPLSILYSWPSKHIGQQRICYPLPKIVKRPRKNEWIIFCMNLKWKDKLLLAWESIQEHRFCIGCWTSDWESSENLMNWLTWDSPSRISFGALEYSTKDTRGPSSKTKRTRTEEESSDSIGDAKWVNQK